MFKPLKNKTKTKFRGHVESIQMSPESSYIVRQFSFETRMKAAKNVFLKCFPYL